MARFSKLTSALMLVIWILLAYAAAVPGIMCMTGSWYDLLSKPAWTPPAQLFGPVWSLLYLMMGIAAWLVWREKGRRRRHALICYCCQLGLNALWAPLFFGLHEIGWALLEILLLLLAIGITFVLFWRRSRLAGILLLPYWAWVSFAAALNAAIWWLNP